MNNNVLSTPLGRSLDMSLREWIDYYQAYVAMKQVRYRGVPTWKNVLDLWVIRKFFTRPSRRSWPRSAANSEAPPFGFPTS